MVEFLGGAFLLERWRASRCLSICKGDRVASYWARKALDVSKERFAGDKSNIDVVWVHAASLGEALSVTNFLQKIIAAKKKKLNTNELIPAYKVVLTFSSESVVAGLPKRWFSDRCPALDVVDRSSVSLKFIPFDFPRRVDAFLATWNPSVAIFVESEFWPNLLLGARRVNIPLLLIQGRMSKKTFQRWSAFRFTQEAIASLLNCFDLIITQSEADLARIRSAIERRYTWCHPSEVYNLKRDSIGLERQGKKNGALDLSLVRDTSWIAGSTHEGEELAIADIHCALLKRQADLPLLTLIAPRRPERAKNLKLVLSRRMKNAGDLHTKVLLLSECEDQAKHLGQEPYIVIVDSLGELSQMYTEVDVAFVGGSLPSSSFHGKHNVYEPQHAGCGLVLQGICAYDSSDDAHETFVKIVDEDGLLLHLRDWFSKSLKRSTKLPEKQAAGKTEENISNIVRLAAKFLKDL